MDDFPLMLYRCPGEEPIHGGHFATLIVADAEEQNAAEKAGWHLTTDAARDVLETSQRGSVSGRAPSREELEQKATELGIPFGPRVSDKKLGEAIAAKLVE